MALTCNNNYLLPYSATFSVPKEFGFVDPTKFSMAISTKNLVVYKTIVEQAVQNVSVVCSITIPEINVKIAQVNLSGSINFRVAANGIQTDTLAIDPNAPAPVPDVTFEPAWSSANGIASVINPVTNSNSVALAYIPVSQEITGNPYTVYLYSMEVSNINEEPTSDDKTVTISGYFKIVYTPIP